MKVYGNSILCLQLFYKFKIIPNTSLFKKKKQKKTSGVREDTAITEFRIKTFLNLKVT